MRYWKEAILQSIWAGASCLFFPTLAKGQGDLSCRLQLRMLLRQHANLHAKDWDPEASGLYEST